ncbi:MAG: ATP-binding protein [bacterium]
MLLLALGSAWLLHRGELITQNKQMTSHGRSLAELVAHGVNESMSFQESARQLRILECATRGGQLEAAAIIDSLGTVLTHTDLNRAGNRLDIWPIPYPVPEADTVELGRQLFGTDVGQVLLHPIIRATGTIGSVAVLLPDPDLFGRNANVLPFFLPAGLLLLAFIVISQATLRRAVQPTSDFLEKLTAALKLHQDQPPDDQDESAAVADADLDPQYAMKNTVGRVQALAKLRDELIIKTRLVDYEKKRMELILDTFPDGLIISNSVTDLVFINRRAMRIFGISGRREDVKNLQDVPGLDTLLQEADKTGQVFMPLEQDGHERNLILNRIPLTVTGSQTAHILFTLRDVTAQQAAQRTQAEFLSQISHELKAPLNTIVTFVEELAENEELSNEERRDYCNILDGEAKRMAQLISNLLQLSRIQLGNLSVNFSFVKTASLLRDQTESLRRQAESHGLDLISEIPDNLPAINGDKDLLGVSFNNLLSNAIKYTPASGRIVVSAQEADRGIEICVEDTGIGIAEEQHEKIFERFYRSQDDQVREKQGSGLGLALANEIVEVHGGTIKVESKLGSGSRFRIWLPAREVGAQPTDIDQVFQPVNSGGNP